jgi:hypothetical protein
MRCNGDDVIAVDGDRQRKGHTRFGRHDLRGFLEDTRRALHGECNQRKAYKRDAARLHA